MEVCYTFSSITPPGRLARLAATAALLLSWSNALGQELPRSAGDCWREPLLPGCLNALRLQCGGKSDTPGVGNREAVRLFRMTTGYLADPVGVVDTDPQLVADQETLPASDGDGPSRVQVTAGNDNPYLDFRRAGDPGGVGYWRVNSQVQFLDTGRTGCTLGLRAATPAGLEYDGVRDGPTVVAPNLGWYYDLGDGAALHGFVGKSVRAGGGWTDNLGKKVEFGFAVHHPLPVLDSSDTRNLFLFVQALGRQRLESFGDQRRTSAWDVLPGLHYRINENWWMSGGVIVPVGASRSELGSWQITCSWQF